MKNIYYFNITYRCNNNCLFCAANHGLNDTNKEMGVEEFSEIMDSYSVDSADRVIINGGEPTVHRRFFEILDIVSSRKAYIDLFTNGVKLNDEDFTARLLEYGPMLVRVPFFGANSEIHDWLTGISGNFNRTVKGIENLVKLKKKNVEIEIKMLLSKATVNENRKIFDYFSSRFEKDFYFSLNPLLVSERVKQNKDIIIEKYSESVNSSLDLINYIRSKGWELSTDLIPFCLFPKEYYEDHLQGVDRNIREIYSDPNISYEMENKYTCKKCNKCVLNNICAGFPSSYLEYMGDEEVKPISVND